MNLLGFPSDGVGQRPQDIGWFNQLLQNVALGGQRESIVQHLIQKLINNDIILFDDRLGAISKVILECINHSVQELDHKQRLGLLLASGHQRYGAPLD